MKNYVIDEVTITYNMATTKKFEVFESKAKPAPDTPGYEVSPATLMFCFNCGPPPAAEPVRGIVEIIPLQTATAGP